jgi:phosphatidylinositol-3-phosphatase
VTPSSRSRLALSLIAGLLCLMATIPAHAELLANPRGGSTARTRAPVVVIVMENHSYDAIVGSSAAPYLRSFAKRGTLFTHYFALHHPSLPNYLEMTSGSTSGCATDSCPQKRYRTKNLFSQLTGAGVWWRAWAESMGTHCRSSSSGTYMARHNPPLYYRDLFPRICPTHDTSLPHHLPSRLPKFVFLTPNACHDMHDCSIATGDAWLRVHATELLRRGATVVVVFDEGTDSAGGGGHVYAAVAGAGVPRGVRDGHRYSHRSLLAGLERHFGLPRLHGAKRARPLPI